MDVFQERTVRLIGEENALKLKNSTVVVFGIGGVGGNCVEALARAGVGTLVLVDADQVTESNINRQVIALRSTVGRDKVDVMRERIADIAPNTKVFTHKTFVLVDNVSEILDGCGNVDYIIDAIDTVTAKLSIAQYAMEHHIPVVSSMGTGNKLDAGQFRIEKLEKTSVCPLCKVMRRECKDRGISGLEVLYSTEKPTFATEDKSVPGSISFVPPVAGLLLAGHVVRRMIQA